MAVDESEGTGDWGRVDTDRIEAFSDGVFAIGLVLLGLELVVPQLDTATNAQLLNALVEQWLTYVAFALSFGSILVMWMNHHIVFTFIEHANARVMAANGFLLLVITVVPYATSLLTYYLATPADNIVAAAYSAVFVLANLAYNLLWWAAATDRACLSDTVSDTEVRMISRSYLVGFPLYLLAGGLAFVSPSLTLVVLLGLWGLWVALPYAHYRPARLRH